MLPPSRKFKATIRARVRDREEPQSFDAIALSLALWLGLVVLATFLLQMPAPEGLTPDPGIAPMPIVPI